MTEKFNHCIITTETEEADAPAWGTLGAGVIMAGTGTVMLALTIPAYIDYNNAVEAYNAADSSTAAVIGLGILSMVLFNTNDNETIPEISFLPSSDGVRLSFRLGM